MNHNKAIRQLRLRRRRRVRKRIQGDAKKPRLSISRSHKHISCQVIDDAAGITVVSASTRDKALRDSFSNGGNKHAAEVVGKTVAEKALGEGIQQVSFDRGSYKYHGRVAALAEAAREAGLRF